MLRIKACVTILGLSIQIILVGLNPPWGVRGSRSLSIDVRKIPSSPKLLWSPGALVFHSPCLARGILSQAAFSLNGRGMQWSLGTGWRGQKRPLWRLILMVSWWDPESPRRQVAEHVCEVSSRLGSLRWRTHPK